MKVYQVSLQDGGVPCIVGIPAEPQELSVGDTVFVEDEDVYEAVVLRVLPSGRALAEVELDHVIEFV